MSGEIDPYECPECGKVGGHGVKQTPIAICRFCGDDATVKTPDNTPCCENCAESYIKVYLREERLRQRASVLAGRSYLERREPWLVNRSVQLVSAEKRQSLLRTQAFLVLGCPFIIRAGISAKKLLPRDLRPPRPTLAWCSLCLSPLRKR